jgi:hypothetical protein
MNTMAAILSAIALWCGEPAPIDDIFHNLRVQKCRVFMMDCLKNFPKSGDIEEMRACFKKYNVMKEAP